MAVAIAMPTWQVQSLMTGCYGYSVAAMGVFLQRYVELVTKVRYSKVCLLFCLLFLVVLFLYFVLSLCGPGVISVRNRTISTNTPALLTQ